MKKSIIVQTLVGLTLMADITLTQEQEKSWQIQTVTAKEVQHVPVGEYLMKVTIPPQLLHTLSVPYEAQVIHLNKANFEEVSQGEEIARLTATKWIEAQKDAISDAIELIHHEHVAERKAKLCKEEVIAQKECIAANAEVKTDKIKLSASRTLLKAYGASDAMLNTLFKDLKIFPQIPVLSPIKGTLLEVNIQPGKSVSPSSSIFLIKEDGDYWLESDLTRATAAGLTPSMEVFIRIDGEDIRSRLLHLSPVVNPHNQTRLARFALPKGHKLIAGTRSNAKLSIGVSALFVDKKAVVQGKGKRVVFIKTGHSYRANPVEVLAENQNGYYLRYDKALKGDIVMGAASVLSNMLDRGE